MDGKDLIDDVDGSGFPTNVCHIGRPEEHTLLLKSALNGDLT
jgi:hypothetical protein